MSESFTPDLQARRQAMSALLDGDGTADTAAAACALWARDTQAREAWRTYHLIGDALRSDDLAASSGERDEVFLANLRRRLADEPAVLAPRQEPAPVRVLAPVREPLAAQGRPWLGRAALAAGFAAVAGVLVVTRLSAPGAGASPAPVLAAMPVQPATAAGAQAAADRLGDPQWQVVDGKLIRDARLDGYLRAHRGGQVAMPGGATGRFETVVLER